MLSSQPPYHEKTLLQQIAAGEEKAFKTLFERTYPAVYRAALLVTASPYFAEEVVQDVFLMLWVKRRDLPGIADFRSYVFIVARNQAYKTLKKQLRWQQLQEESPQTAEEQAHLLDIEERLETAEILRVYENAVNALPPRQQQVFKLSKQQRLSREQVARHMQISPETVKKYLALAVLNIRAYCQKNAPELLQSISALLVINRMS